MIHYDEGSLRALLDGEAGINTAAIKTHLAACDQCRTRLEEVRSNAAQHHQLFGMSAIPPEPEAALKRFHATLRADSMSVHDPLAEAALQAALLIPKGKSMKNNTVRKMPAWLTPVGILLVAIALLALPPVRAAADQLLQIFRVQTVMFVPVSEERMQQLGALNLDEKSLFVAEPTERVKSVSHSVANAAEASSAVGFDIAEPTEQSASSYTVSTKSEVAFQVDVAAAREVLQLTGVDDITLPDALGSQPIIVNMSEVVQSSYTINGSRVSLIQGASPQVTLPDGVDLAQLGKLALRVLGMAPDQAEALSAQVDWSTTLIFPFPANINTMRQVSINGAPGMVITETRGNGAAVYWQRGDRFYVLQINGRSYGDDVTPIVQLAESIH